MYKSSRLLLGLLLLLPAWQVTAQTITNSPFSRLGIGELNNGTASIRNFGMGGVGVASPNSAFINDVNPALLTYNNFVNFETGVTGEIKQIAGPNQRYVVGDGNLSHVALSLPLSRRWSAVVGLRPYSTVQYQTRSLETVTNSPGVQVLKTYEGEGGLSEAYFAHGVRLFKGLSVGVSGSYVFGSIFNNTGTILGDTALSPVKTVFSTRTHYSDFLFKTGLSYRHGIQDKVFLGVGAVYSLGSDLSGNRQVVLERRDLLNNGLQEETILTPGQDGSVRIPQGLTVGLSADNNTNWAIGMDFSTQRWSEYRSFENLSDLADAYRFSLGGEITPDMVSMDSYLKRVTYRAGISYAQTPLVVNGVAVPDMSLSWGASFPVGRISAQQRSYVNLGMAVGRRGSLSDNLLHENYFRFQVGFALNNRWFVKRRLE